jgi:hypothetical protein
LFCVINMIHPSNALSYMMSRWLFQSLKHILTLSLYQLSASCPVIMYSLCKEECSWCRDRTMTWKVKLKVKVLRSIFKNLYKFDVQTTCRRVVIVILDFFAPIEFFRYLLRPEVLRKKCWIFFDKVMLVEKLFWK